jgi:type IV secretory pathway protease TraF
MKVWKKRVIVIAITVLCVACLSSMTSKMVYAISGSLNYKLFWKSDDMELRDHRYIMFLFHGDEYYPDEANFIKRIACLPGQKLAYNGSAWSCDNALLRNGEYTYDTDRVGKKLPRFCFSGIIPDDRFFVLGDSPDSYDSKYWGFVERDSILYTLDPIW